MEMVESFWTRLTSPFTGLIGGTYEQMGKRDWNPLKGDWNPFSGFDQIKIAVGLVVGAIILIMLLPYLLPAAVAVKKYRKKSK